MIFPFWLATNGLGYWPCVGIEILNNPWNSWARLRSLNNPWNTQTISDDILQRYCNDNLLAKNGVQASKRGICWRRMTKNHYKKKKSSMCGNFSQTTLHSRLSLSLYPELFGAVEVTMAYPLNIFPIRFSVGFSVSEPPRIMFDHWHWPDLPSLWPFSRK